MVNLVNKYIGEAKKKKKPIKRSKCCGAKVVWNPATGDTVCSSCRDRVPRGASYMSENILASIGSIGKMPGTWGKRLGTFGTVLYRALDREGITVINLEPIGKFDNELTVIYKGKEKKVKLTGDSSADKVLKKIKGK